MMGNTSSSEPVFEPARPYRRNALNNGEPQPIKEPRPMTEIERFHFFMGDTESKISGKASTDERDPFVWMRRKGGYVSEAGARALWKKYREFTGGVPINASEVTFLDWKGFSDEDEHELDDNDRWAIEAYEEYLETSSAKMDQDILNRSSNITIVRDAAKRVIESSQQSQDQDAQQGRKLTRS